MSESEKRGEKKDIKTKLKDEGIVIDDNEENGKLIYAGFSEKEAEKFLDHLTDNINLIFFC